MGKYHDTEHLVGAFGWAGRDTSGVLSPFNFSRRFLRRKSVGRKNWSCGVETGADPERSSSGGARVGRVLKQVTGTPGQSPLDNRRRTGLIEIK
ncbi:hypothetical protein MIMGU_mgv11b016649mg [Erythranthe guttata]|uniref:Uncharacterized protein n=1 Tax=Erythranthe guttata TaxID=4155 RepID=A0A022QIR7_ERYGU|nr:hypothetical protein MIMGU_mgv11b016649mg [Erythranthe guttata]